jgi:hypothetical protein
VAYRLEVRPRLKLHGSIVNIDIVEGDPTTHERGGRTFPVPVVLMPCDLCPVARWLKERLIVKELNIGTD